MRLLPALVSSHLGSIITSMKLVDLSFGRKQFKLRIKTRENISLGVNDDRLGKMYEIISPIMIYALINYILHDVSSGPFVNKINNIPSSKASYI